MPLTLKEELCEFCGYDKEICNGECEGHKNKMKKQTEFDIAKDNLSYWRIKTGKLGRFICLEHKKSCERFLDFLEKDMIDFMNLNGTCHKIMNKKIADLKQAIKEYEKEGI